jgi:hypothetical protein
MLWKQGNAAQHYAYCYICIYFMSQIFITFSHVQNKWHLAAFHRAYEAKAKLDSMSLKTSFAMCLEIKLSSPLPPLSLWECGVSELKPCILLMK